MSNRWSRGIVAALLVAPMAVAVGFGTAQADAMKSDGLTKAGFQYVNVDDFWYQCPGSQGPLWTATAGG